MILTVITKLFLINQARAQWKQNVLEQDVKRRCERCETDVGRRSGIFIVKACVRYFLSNFWTPGSSRKGPIK